MGVPELSERLAEIDSAVKKELREADPEFLQQHPISHYLAQFETLDTYASYRSVPASINRFCDATQTSKGQLFLERYHQLALIHLMTEFNNSLGLPQSVLSLVYENFAKIVQGISKNESGYYLHENDLFSKDLGCCRLKLIPCGSELVDRNAGLPRSTLVQGGVGQFIKGLWFLGTRVGGFRPYFESHWDRRLIRGFNENAYNQFYLNVATLLECNPDVQALSGSSWWYDPALLKVSPKLAFLQTVPLKQGAMLFKVGRDETATEDALYFSLERKKAFDAGEYHPTVYTLVWGRKDLLAWAEGYRQQL